MSTAKVVSLSNQKGGVGKSVTTANHGIGLARQGKKALLIDGDPQASLTISLGYQKPDELPVTLATVMNAIMEETPPASTEDVLHHTQVRGFKAFSYRPAPRQRSDLPGARPVGY